MQRTPTITGMARRRCISSPVEAWCRVSKKMLPSATGDMAGPGSGPDSSGCSPPAEVKVANRVGNLATLAILGVFRSLSQRATYFKVATKAAKSARGGGETTTPGNIHDPDVGSLPNHHPPWQTSLINCKYLSCKQSRKVTTPKSA